MWSLGDPAQVPDPAWLDTPGAFLWWYVDALDAQGDGLVCIWSWGLPFLPGDRAARRHGPGPTPADRPSFNLVAYRRHRAVSYTLYRPRTASWNGDTWTMDANVITRHRDGGNTTLHADIDLPIPGSTDRLHGTFTLQGPTAHLAPGMGSPAGGGRANPAHAWAPLTGPSSLTVRLSAGDRAVLHAEGLPAYHDRNASTVPLEALGMKRWTWGRHTFPGRTWVHYLSWPYTPGAPPVLVVAELADDGQVTVHPLATIGRRDPRQGRVGMRWWRVLDIPTPDGPLQVLHGPPVDDGPFYLRLPTRARLAGEGAPGWAEWCEPDRIDRRLHRWPVSMVIQHADPTLESRWTPLFGGPSDGRLGRLLARWTGRAP